jgi:DNA modification methylase
VHGAPDAESRCAARQRLWPFNGSGSSLIAAEQLGRQLRAIELTPSYVQQAIDRWEQSTGKKAVKVGGL